MLRLFRRAFIRLALVSVLVAAVLSLGAASSQVGTAPDTADSPPPAADTASAGKAETEAAPVAPREEMVDRAPVAPDEGYGRTTVTEGSVRDCSNGGSGPKAKLGMINHSAMYDHCR